MAKLWEKGYDVDKLIGEFSVGDDYLLDMKLLPYDCLASIAHARMLKSIGILTGEESDQLESCLKEIMDLHAKGKFLITEEDEDSHTAIENYLTKKLGETGKKIHTGRSRNDQVLVNIKLYMREESIAISGLALELSKSLLEFSRKHDVVMPGYTHMRKAMPSTSKLWASSHAESLLDDIQLLQKVMEVLDTCPLGSAAGYGVSLPLDRKMVSDMLGFREVQENVIYVQNSRGKNEARFISCLAGIMMSLNRMASDIILFSMDEFGFFKIPEKLTTGSSIMPQKRNPDALELIRAKSKQVLALHNMSASIALDLTSGYNRDLQLTKKPLIESIGITGSSLAVMKLVIDGLSVEKDSCAKAMADELYATDLAYGLVKGGLPFREAYRIVADQMPDVTDEVKKESINAKSYPGAPGNPFGDIEIRINRAESSIVQAKLESRRILESLLGKEL